VEGGGRSLTVSGVSRNRGGFVKCVTIQKRLGIPAIGYVKWDPHHHGMAHSQVADGGEGLHIRRAVADIRQVVVLQLGVK
jgi:hypothetical protein